MTAQGRASWGLAALVVAAGLTAATSMLPTRGGTVGTPPTPLPASLDPGFVDSMQALARRVPESAEVAILVTGPRRSVSSWYWTMAAFSHPALVSRRLSPGGASTARWVVCPTDVALDPPWRPAGCEKAWCLWRR